MNIPVVRLKNITMKLLKLASLFGGKPKQGLEKLKNETK